MKKLQNTKSTNMDDTYCEISNMNEAAEAISVEIY